VPIELLVSRGAVVHKDHDRHDRRDAVQCVEGEDAGMRGARAMRWQRISLWPIDQRAPARRGSAAISKGCQPRPLARISATVSSVCNAHHARRRMLADEACKVQHAIVPRVRSPEAERDSP